MNGWAETLLNSRGRTAFADAVDRDLALQRSQLDRHYYEFTVDYGLPELTHALREGSYVIASHSYGHMDKRSSSVELVRGDIARWEQRVGSGSHRVLHLSLRRNTKVQFAELSRLGRFRR